MGYTHYWTSKVVSEDKFKKFAATCKKLYKALPDTSETASGCYSDDEIVICGGNGKGKPLFRNDEVWFNGDDKRGLEAFCIELEDKDYNSCKTERKPYDLLVVACLIAAHEILGYEITSDGDFEDWKLAINYYLRTLYTKMPNDEAIKLILPEFIYKEYCNL